MDTMTSSLLLVVGSGTSYVDTMTSSLLLVVWIWDKL